MPVIAALWWWLSGEAQKARYALLQLYEDQLRQAYEDRQAVRACLSGAVQKTRCALLHLYQHCLRHYFEDDVKDYVEDNEAVWAVVELLPLASCMLLGLVLVAVVVRLWKRSRRCAEATRLSALVDDARLSAAKHRQVAEDISNAVAAINQVGPPPSPSNYLQLQVMVNVVIYAPV